MNNIESRIRSGSTLSGISHIYVTGLIVWMLIRSVAGAGEPGTLTLRRACEEAASGNARVEAGEFEAKAARERETQARARFWPTVGISTGSVHTDRPDISLGLLADQNEPVAAAFTDRPDVDNYRSEVGLDYVIYDGGRRRHAATAAAHRSRAGAHVVAGTRAVVLMRTVETFYAALSAEYQIEIAAEEVDRMGERMALARKLKDAGRGSDADVSTAEYHLEDAKRQLLSARHAATNAREELGILLGRNSVVRERLDEGDSNPLDRAAVLFGSAETEAVRSSPRLATLREEVAGREAAVRGGRSAWIPTVSVSARYGYDGEDAFDFDSDRDSYAVGLVVSWNAFDGGARGARIREAEDLEAAASARLREGEERIRRTARQSVRICVEADAAHRTSKKKAASYTARYQVKAKGYEAGRVSFEDVLQAQSDLALARLEEVRAYCATRSSRARLLEATGSW